MKQIQEFAIDFKEISKNTGERHYDSFPFAYFILFADFAIKGGWCQH
jgi:hypothetical protein